MGRGGAKTWGRRGVLRDIASDEVVRFEDVRAAYDGVEVFRNLSFVINAGEAVALLGPNGCGKSTVVDMITGDSPLAFGQAVTLFGRRKGSGESVWDIKRKIGHSDSTVAHAIFHIDLRPHDSTVAHAVPPTPSGVGRAARRCRRGTSSCPGFYDTIGLYDRPAAEHGDIADAWVATLGIGDLVSATPGSFTRLSLGQQKLVLLCRALVKRPRLLVLDEPTHALSRSSRGSSRPPGGSRRRGRGRGAREIALNGRGRCCTSRTARTKSLETLNCDDVALLARQQNGLLCQSANTRGAWPRRSAFGNWTFLNFYTMKVISVVSALHRRQLSGTLEEFASPGSRRPTPRTPIGKPAEPQPPRGSRGVGCA